LGMGFRRSGSGPRPRTPTHAEATEGVAMIEALGLTRAYDGLRAVDDLTLEVPRGSVFGFLGRNGAGKTTTVKMLSTVLYPSAGTAAVGGFDVRNEALKVRSIIGVIGEGTRHSRETRDLGAASRPCNKGEGHVIPLQPRRDGDRGSVRPDCDPAPRQALLHRVEGRDPSQRIPDRDGIAGNGPKTPRGAS